jgi:hypothetical protein
MTETTATLKAYVQGDDCITIRCPDCNQPACIKVESFRNKCNTLRVRCTCKTVFKVRVDYRRFYRKPTRIPGSFVPAGQPDQGEEEILIINISKEGMGFKVFTGHGVKQSDTLWVSFELDDRKKTCLRKKVQVQSVNDDVIGCRFSDPDLFEKALGFYLQN